MGVGAHGSCHTDALLVILESPFFVAVTPQEDTRMIAVPLDHPLQQTKVLVVDAHQSVLIDDEYSFTVADIK